MCGDGVCDLLHPCIILPPPPPPPPACSLYVSYHISILHLSPPPPPPILHSYLPSKIAGTTFGVMTMSEMKEKCVFFSMRRAWQLGRAVLRAQRTRTNVLDAIKEQQNGIILITGKVSLCREDSSPPPPPPPPPPLDLYPAGFFFVCVGYKATYSSSVLGTRLGKGLTI